MMLCAVCTEEILYVGDEIKCSNCKDYFHFSCASFREAVFRKSKSQLKDKWCCQNCKLNTKKSTADTVNNVVYSNGIFIEYK